MKTSRWLLTILAFAFMLGIPSMEAGSFSSSAVSQPWRVQLFKGGEDGIRNLSTAFVGQYQVPMLSYSKDTYNNIYLAHQATAAVPGNCGPSNAWYCSQWFYGNLVPGTVSPMAVMQKTDTHLLGFAFSTGSMIRGAMIELKNDMSFYTSSQQDLIKLSKFGGTLIGVPSLRIVGGHYQMAVTIADNSDLFGYELVYMSYTIMSNTTCLDGATNYYCEVIDQSYGLNSMGAPSLQVAGGFTAGVAYYKAGSTNGLMFAYPNLHLPSNYSNCGENTWRCISIFPDVGTSVVGADVKLAVGKSAFNMGIAFTFGNTTGSYLFHAGYVGSGGNCGADVDNSGNNIDKWQCKLLYWLGKFDRSYSIVIDPQGYPVIAYDYPSSEDSPVDLYITYPDARAGLGSTDWVEQLIDSAPTTLVTTGDQAALAINDSGRGFIGYLQAEDYSIPDLKTAIQYSRLFLPLIRR